MRYFILAAACIAAASGGAVSAGEQKKQSATTEISFAEGGVYIGPGASVDVTIAGECRRLTNHDEKVGFYITPALHDAWPDAQDRAPLEPKLTEEQCK